MKILKQYATLINEKCLNSCLLIKLFFLACSTFLRKLNGRSTILIVGMVYFRYSVLKDIVEIKIRNNGVNRAAILKNIIW